MAERTETTGSNVLLDQAVAALDAVLRSPHPSRELPPALQPHPGLAALYADLVELHHLVQAIANGDLHHPIRQKGFMAGCLRSLQAKLRHLTWQTQRIAAGDFSQRVDFLGEFSAAFNAMTDALARAKADLKESERRYRLLAENAADVICTLDLDGRYTYLSPSVARVLGYAQDELLGQPLDGLLPAESGRPYREMLEGYLKHEASGRPGSAVEMPLRHKNGSLAWTEWTLAPLCDEAGQKVGLIAVIRDISERKRLQEELLHLATADPLTGAANRRHFLELANQEMLRAVRYGHPVSVIVLDIDRFKRINDTYGHAAGDQVLCTLVEVSRRTLRATDVVGRMGGEEFAVLLPVTSGPDAVRIAERLRKAFAETQVPLPDGGATGFTASLGVAERQPGERTVEPLLRRADLALYRAKRQGRNRVCTEADPG